jgi:hypothetical protein
MFGHRSLSSCLVLKCTALRGRHASRRQDALCAGPVLERAHRHWEAWKWRKTALAVPMQVWSRSARIPLDWMVGATSRQLGHGALTKILVTLNVVHSDWPERVPCKRVLAERNEGPHMRLAVGPGCLRAFRFHPPLEALLCRPRECRLRADRPVPRQPPVDRIEIGTRATGGLVPVHSDDRTAASAAVAYGTSLADRSQPTSAGARPQRTVPPSPVGLLPPSPVGLLPHAPP